MGGLALGQLRRGIDEIDDRILGLLDERAHLARRVARAKAAENLPIHDPERERRVLDRLASRAGALPSESIRAVYREIIGACRALQEQPAVAFLGPDGTYSHAAARAIFGPSAAYAHEATIPAVFDAVTEGRAAYGVVPFENSSAGLVEESVAGVLAGEVRVRGEIVLGVPHCLLSQAPDLASVERVYSHPQALAQCRSWLEKNLAKAELVPSASTAAAVEDSLAHESSAAIASPLAAEIYGIGVLRKGIQDHPDNRTRFLLLAAS